MELIDEVVGALARGELEVRFVGRHDWDGELDWDGLVSISIYAPAPVAVLIHEVVHWVRQDWSEEEVLRHERMLYQNLTAEDRRYLEHVVRRAKRRWLKRRKQKNG